MNRKQRRLAAKKAGKRAGTSTGAAPAPAAGETLDLALASHRAGRLDEAGRLYREFLRRQPDHPEALHLLGVVAHQTGEHDTAIDLIGKAIAINGAAAGYHNNIGEAYRAAGKIDEAFGHYRRAADLDPNFADAHHNLGVASLARGEADEAVGHLRRALALEPALAEAHFCLGNALREQGKLDEAIAAYRRAVVAEPGFAAAHDSLGNAYLDRGELDEAVACHRKAIALEPDLAGAHNNLGNALVEQGETDEAVASFHKAIALEPDFAWAHYNLGAALGKQDKLDDAVTSYREAIALKLDFAEAHNNLGQVLKGQGRLEEASASYRKAVALKPDDAVAHSNLLFHLLYLPGLTPEGIFAEHRRWNAQHAAPLANKIRSHTNIRDPERPLRVGYVSAGFGRHPAGYFVSSVLAAHDRARFEVYCYSGRVREDDLTARIKASAKVWRSTDGMADDVLAQTIRADGIDILVDLDWHTSGNRLRVFAMKPAPVQVKGVGGNFGTTGMDAIDYYLSDAVATPEGAERWFSEEVVRLPDGFGCYAPPADAPDVGPLPALSRGYVTFGCFNNLAKVNGEVIASWARLLHRLPVSRLVLKTDSLGDPAVRERYHSMFEAQGVDRKRGDLLARSPHAELLAHYNNIDIALDPFPYSGGLTTCEALWMAVPVVTLAGKTFTGRTSASHLHNVGLGDWVVKTPEDYLAVAERWGRDVQGLAELRGGLRGRMAASPLCDGARYARNLETAFRRMWTRYCNGEHEKNGSMALGGENGVGHAKPASPPPPASLRFRKPLRTLRYYENCDKITAFAKKFRKIPGIGLLRVDTP
ncbi:MAG: tetratricopeptide repeat protein [Proteobacteria bacterium]|nr:tetratricopeptide repeat protein [Pseudomonadota bacterium]